MLSLATRDLLRSGLCVLAAGLLAALVPCGSADAQMRIVIENEDGVEVQVQAQPNAVQGRLVQAQPGKRRSGPSCW